MTAVDSQDLVPMPAELRVTGAPPQVITGDDPAVLAVTPRDRLLKAAIKVFARLGYEKATIADIVREARVSRRTFYEHFDDKRDCLFATYDVTTTLLVSMVTEAVSEGGVWQERLLKGVDRFVDVMLIDPDVTRVMVTEVMAAGHDAVARRRQAHRQWAMMWVKEFAAAREADESIRPLSREPSLLEAQVLVAAVQEMVMLAIEGETEPDRLEIARGVRSLILAMVMVPPVEIVVELDRIDGQRQAPPPAG